MIFEAAVWPFPIKLRGCVALTMSCDGNFCLIIHVCTVCTRLASQSFHLPVAVALQHNTTRYGIPAVQQLTACESPKKIQGQSVKYEQSCGLSTVKLGYNRHLR